MFHSKIPIAKVQTAPMASRSRHQSKAFLSKIKSEGIPGQVPTPLAYILRVCTAQCLPVSGKNQKALVYLVKEDITSSQYNEAADMAATMNFTESNDLYKLGKILTEIDIFKT
ncbi:unnamed protein product [Moneuplotes crassus]|uniref:Uncharacterized protein n=1 Tax=Euplotes crassus TaxID=5936 RepID=A0AAD1XXX4_EUPCR|nr:unnamed protein product [Moneuplotes crassus]